MRLRIAVRNEASDDLTDAFLFYEDKRTNLGYEFLDDWEATVNYVAQYPFAFEMRHKAFHAAPLKRFPFIVIYEIEENRIVVFAVAHTSMNPKKRYERK